MKIMKMWCLCRKKDGRPIKIDLFDDRSNLVTSVGFATKESLMLAVDVQNDGEVIRRIDFEY